MIAVSDNADGSGLNVTLTGIDPTAAVTIQVRDSAQPDYRNTATGTGPGLYRVAIGEGTDQITFTRSYFVRASYVVGVLESFTGDTLVTATQGYNTDIFQLILAAKHKLITAGIQRIGGKVFHCIDPAGAIDKIGELPALFVNQAEGEQPQPMDNRTTGLVVPIRVTLGTNDNRDWIASLEYFTYARQAIFNLFDRQSTDPGRTAAGRRWRVRPDGTEPLDPQGIYTGTSMTLLTDIERRIGGN